METNDQKNPVFGTPPFIDLDNPQARAGILGLPVPVRTAPKSPLSGVAPTVEKSSPTNVAPTVSPQPQQQPSQAGVSAKAPVAAPPPSGAAKMAEDLSKDIAIQKFKQAHPWGSEASNEIDPSTGQPFAGNHPGKLGKFLHGAATVGNTIGRIVAPNVTAAIPGSQLGREAKIAQESKQELAAEKQGSETALQGAETKAAEAKAAGNTAATALAEKAAKDDLYPVSHPDGSVTYQKLDRALSDEEFSHLTPEGQYAYALNSANKAAAGSPEAAAWKQKADSALSAVNAKVAPGQKPIGDPTQYTNRVSDLPNLSKEQKAHYSPDPKDTPEQAEKKLADARDLDARIAQGREQGVKETDQKNAKLQSEKDKVIHNTEDTLKKDNAKIEDANNALSMLRDPNGMKDALVVVKGLVVTAGGQGSGVRITNAELQRIATSRGWTESAGVTANNLFNPDKFESMSPQQREQLGGIIQDVLGRVQKRTNMIYAERTAVRNATSVEEINKIENTFDAQMKAMGQGKDYTAADLQAYANAHTKGDLNAARKQYEKHGGVEVPE